MTTAERIARLRKYPRDLNKHRATTRILMKSRYWSAVELGECTQSGCMDAALKGRRKCSIHLDLDTRRNQRTIKAR
jgi:hypothetical protein